MTEQQIFIITEILGVLVLLSALISLQAKKVIYLVIFQCISNVLVTAQYFVRGEFSATGICILGAVETLLIFALGRKNKKLPKLAVAAFILSGAAYIIVLSVSGDTFSLASDLVPLSAWVLFNFAMISSGAALARFLMMLNGSLWLVLNIINFDPSLFVTYLILVCVAIVSIIRLDRAEWKSFFSSNFKKSEKNEEK